ncbi:hypothetical protein ACSBR2_032892 [Camellia fascicularis]
MLELESSSVALFGASSALTTTKEFEVLESSPSRSFLVAIFFFSRTLIWDIQEMSITDNRQKSNSNFCFSFQSLTSEAIEMI